MPFGLDLSENNPKLECYWYKDVVRGKNNHWYINVAFQNGLTKPKDLRYPIGALPNFRLGRQYQGRRDVTTSARGNLSSITFADFSQGRLVTAWPTATAFFSFYRDKDIGKQWLWEIKKGPWTFYFPCVELVRALFMPNSTFARALFRPSGLSEICAPPADKPFGLHFDFYPNVPVAAINAKPILRLLTWLYLDEEAKKSWHSIYKNHASSRHKDETSIPMKFHPPALKEVTIKFRGRDLHEALAKTLVLEIEQITLPPIGIGSISYSHPKLKNRKESEQTTARAKTIHVKKPDQNTTEESIDGTKPGANVVVKTPLTLFDSEENFYAELIRVGEAEISKTPSVDRKLPPSGTIRKNVSAGDADKDGDAISLEFKSVGRGDIKKDDGLYVFSAAIRAIQSANPNWIVKMQIFELQGDNKFCFAFNRRRRCLLAEIRKPSAPPIWLLEIERTGGIMRSTLVICAKSNQNPELLPRAVQFIADGLERLSGRWPEVQKSWIKEFFAVSRINHPFDYENSPTPEMTHMFAKRLTASI